MPQPTELLQPTINATHLSIVTDSIVADTPSLIEVQIPAPLAIYPPKQNQARSETEALIDPNGRLSRLLAAAVINRRVCRLLLTNPAAAIAVGYQGETFSLSSSELAVLLPLRADSLPEFADQLLQAIAEHNKQVYELDYREI